MSLSEMAKQRQLTTEDKCIAYLEKMRWPEGIACPECGNKSISRFQAKGKSGKLRHLYQCLDKSCRYQFSPTTGTIFHDSHLPLNKWFEAIALLSDASKPMSANQLRLALGVQHKTATHIASCIRQAIENGTIELHPNTAKEPSVRENQLIEMAGLVPRALARQTRQSGESTTALSGKYDRTSLAARRLETAEFLNQIAAKSDSPVIYGTAVDNMLSMFVSFAQMTVKPPLFFVNYLKDKVFT